MSGSANKLAWTRADNINVSRDRKKHFNGYIWPFLCFRALQMSSIYTDYAIARNRLIEPEYVYERKDNKYNIKKIEMDYPDISQAFDFWNIVNFQDTNIDWSQADMFNVWLSANETKLATIVLNDVYIVKEGTNLEAESGKIYFGVPENYDAKGFWDIYKDVITKAMLELDEAIDNTYPFTLNRGNWANNQGQVLSTERRLDAYYMRKIKRFSNFECVCTAYESSKECWNELKFAIDSADLFESQNVDRISDVEQDDVITKLKNGMITTSKEGQLIIKNALNNQFPSYK